VDVGKDEVTVRTGKQASKKIIHCAVQALIVLFNTQVCTDFIPGHLVNYILGVVSLYSQYLYRNINISFNQFQF